MSRARVILCEALAECRAGARSGVVGLTFVGLAGYLLMSLTNADYMRDMAAAEIPRNAPSLVYLMSAGCMFFLFFAWAWVFGQAALRDRKAGLQEITLTMPVGLSALLWGRFLGAALVAWLLAGSLMVGFIATPLLGWLALVPADAVSAPPWAALGFAWVVLLLPPSLGIGALYFLAALRSRSIGGPFALSALLLLLWMFAVVVLKGAERLPVVGVLIDPSLFTHTLATVETWTPAQKENDLLSLTPTLLFNRLIWGVLPLVLLAAVLPRLRREHLALERPVRAKRNRRWLRAKSDEAAPNTAVADAVRLPRLADAASSWPRALACEAGWQFARLACARALWAGIGVLLVMGISSGLVRGVWNARGPMIGRPEVILPMLNAAMYLIVVFVVAALVGMVWRRDDVEGFDAMLEAGPAPAWLRPFGRIAALAGVILLFACVPGLASIVVTALTAPPTLGLTSPMLYQSLVTAPALLELGLLVVLVHAAIARAGVAYTLSMLLVFVLVLNHELGVFHSPLLTFGITPHLTLSAVGGWDPLLGFLLAVGGYKLGLAATMAALAVLLMPLGIELRRRPLARLSAPVVVVGASGLALALGSGGVLFVELARGDNMSNAAIQVADAGWERRWLAQPAGYDVASGTVDIDIDSATGVVHGQWTLRNVRANGGLLHAELPDGFRLDSARVDGQAVTPTQAFDHLAIPMADCDAGCTVRLQWRLSAPGWSDEGEPTWRGASALWLRADRVMPRLGLDPDRILRSPAERRQRGLAEDFKLPPAAALVAADAIAPRGDWSWRVAVDGQPLAASRGDHQTPLNFAVARSSRLVTTQFLSTPILHAPGYELSAKQVASDVQAMRRCVARRLDTDVDVARVVQWPTGLGGAALVDGQLLLPEDPSWHVAAGGVGQYRRQAAIATAMAGHALRRQADLRAGEGSLWWRTAVPGAVGLLCVADVNSVTALQSLLAQASDDVSRALAESDAPVRTLARARSGGWVAEYGPLAALAWTAQQSAADLTAIGAQLAAGQPITHVLARHMAPATLSAALGAPRASEPLQSEGPGAASVERWVWQAGGWVSIGGGDAVRLTQVDGTTGAQPASRTGSWATGTLLDALPSFPRVLQGAAPTGPPRPMAEAEAVRSAEGAISNHDPVYSGGQ